MKAPVAEKRGRHAAHPATTRVWGLRWASGRSEAKCCYDAAATTVNALSSTPHPPVLVSWLTDEPGDHTVLPTVDVSHVHQQVTVSRDALDRATAAASAASVLDGATGHSVIEAALHELGLLVETGTQP